MTEKKTEITDSFVSLPKWVLVIGVGALLSIAGAMAEARIQLASHGEDLTSLQMKLEQHTTKEGHPVMTARVDALTDRLQKSENANEKMLETLKNIERRQFKICGKVKAQCD